MNQVAFDEVCEIFPLITGAEFSELVEDIRSHGLREPIALYNGRIIDGRNRYRACLEAGIEPTFATWTGNGNGDLLSFVVSKNLIRRHLTPTVKATIGVDILPRLEEAARERQRGGQGGILLPEKFPEAIKSSSCNESELFASEARQEAARLLNVNEHYISDAKAIKEAAPDDFEKMRTGEKTITEVKRTLKQKQLSETAGALPEGKFRVIYADPPWKYGDERGDLPYGPAANHYPAMAISELCALNVEALAAENAVLFLWVTSPMLEQSFKVIDAWGFEYKTSFVWDKVRHNFGHYNSVRHEFLLVSTRGSCTPDCNKLFDSVITVQRGKHSEKPERFRKLIQTLYPEGPRIELFARTKRRGWERWGNECCE